MLEFLRGIRRRLGRELGMTDTLQHLWVVKQLEPSPPAARGWRRLTDAAGWRRRGEAASAALAPCLKSGATKPPPAAAAAAAAAHADEIEDPFGTPAAISGARRNAASTTGFNVAHSARMGRV